MHPAGICGFVNCFLVRKSAGASILGGLVAVLLQERDDTELGPRWDTSEPVMDADEAPVRVIQRQEGAMG